MNRILSMVLAATLTMSCISYSYAEEAPPQPEQSGPSGGAVAAAVISDFFYIPGKLGVCVTSGALWTVAMALTGGMLHREAGDFVHDCCTGKWVLTGEEFMGPEDEVGNPEDIK